MTSVPSVASSLFLKLKGLLGFRRTRTERLGGYDLSQRPFTKAMLLRAAADTDAAEKQLHAMIPLMKRGREPSDLDEWIESSTQSFAFHVTATAMDNIGRRMLLPGDPVPDNERAVVAFSFSVVLALFEPLKKEGYELNFRDTCAGVTHLFAMMHEKNEQFKLYEQSAALFGQVAKSDLPNVKDWREGLEKLVYIFVIQWSSTDVKVKQMKFPSLFGSMLRSFLKVIEPTDATAPQS
jgi:hypothetical protein